MKNFFELFMEGVVSLIPQQAIRFVVHSFLAIGLFGGIKVIKNQLTARL